MCVLYNGKYKSTTKEQRICKGISITIRISKNNNVLSKILGGKRGKEVNDIETCQTPKISIKENVKPK